MKIGNKICLRFLSGCLLLLYVSCGNNQSSKGVINLEEFRIVDATLDSMVNKIVSNFNADTTESVIVLDLIYSTPHIAYYLSVHYKNSVMENYILWNNRRIVGYTYIRESPIMILSSINNHRDFCKVFGQSLELKNNTRNFDYIIMPQKRYEWVTETGDTLDWQEKNIIYDPVYVCFWRNNNGGFEYEVSRGPNDPWGH